MPFNPALHEHLLTQGYSHTHHEAECWDDGDGETGPMPHGCPAYDEYQSADEYVFADERGGLHREARDLELERWLDQQAA